LSFVPRVCSTGRRTPSLSISFPPFLADVEDLHKMGALICVGLRLVV